MKNLKLNQETEITYNEAKELVSGSIMERDFDNLNESTITETVDFEVVQNRKYYVTKIGKKGAKLYPGSEFESIAEVGVFELEMIYNYRHPSNFALNQNNVSRKFKIAF